MVNVRNQDVLLALGGAGVTWYLINERRASQYASRAKGALRALQDERDNPETFTAQDFRDHISKYKSDTRQALVTAEENGCQMERSFDEYQSQANELDTLEEKSAFWKAASARVNRSLVGCVGSTQSELFRQVSNLVFTLGLGWVITSNLPEIVEAIKDLFDGGGGDGPGGGVPPGDEPVIEGTPSQILDNFPIPEGAFKTALSAIGVAIGSRIALGMDAIEAIADGIGVGVDFLVNNPLITIGLAIGLVALAVTVASPIPGDEVAVSAYLTALASRVGIALPSIASMASIGRGITLAA